MRLASFLMALSLAACVERPDADLCLADPQNSRSICFNLLKDYDDSGHIKPEATPHFKPLTQLSDLQDSAWQSAHDFALTKAWLEKLEKQCKH